VKEFGFDTYDFFGYIASGLLVLIGLDLIFDFSDVLGTDMDTMQALAVALASYVVGQILASPAKVLLEDLIVQFGLKKPCVRLMSDPDRRNPFRYLFWGYFQPLTQTVREKITKRVTQGDGNEPTGEDLFVKVRFDPAVRADEALMARMDTFLNKYGFSRNVCFAALCLSIAVFVKSGDLPAGPEREQFLTYGWLLLVSAVLLFFRYLKFLRLYSYEMLNSYAAGATQAADSGDTDKPNGTRVGN
jgi:hypothetical protein